MWLLYDTNANRPRQTNTCLPKLQELFLDGPLFHKAPSVSLLFNQHLSFSDSLESLFSLSAVQNNSQIQPKVVCDLNQFASTMCFLYQIVYYGCSSKARRPPWCNPVINQAREYVNTEGWHLCELCYGEERCNWIRTETCTFVEPYCSDTCEKYYTGVNEIEANKDRLSYANDEVKNGRFPVSASFGHLRVDYERTMLMFESMIELTNGVANGIAPSIEFPITESFPARVAALFITRWMDSGPCADILHAFPALPLEQKMQLLQRIMRATHVASKFSFAIFKIPRTILPYGSHEGHDTQNSSSVPVASLTEWTR